MLFDRLPLPTLVVDRNTLAIVAVNDAAVTYYGWSRDELVTMTVKDIHPDHTAAPDARRQRHVTASGRTVDVDVYQEEATHDGQPAFVMSVVDTASADEARKQIETELAHRALHDHLTGLPNRELFHDRLTVALARAARHHTMVTVLFLDLDRFKVVNDSLGHDAGDRLLVAVGARLRSVLRASDTVARFGGDEFAVLCEDVPDERETIALAERVVNALSKPFVLDKHEVVTTASVGIALSRRTGDRPERLLRDADAAMYRAKERGRSRYEVYDDAMRARSLRWLEAEGALRRAIEREQLDLAFQPCVSLTDGHIRSFEGLLRWTSPEIGDITPSELVKVAEETGLIVAVGSFVIARACRQLAEWTAAGHSAGIAVNVSARQLGRTELFDDLARCINDSGIDPATLCLEITESVLMDDVQASLEALYALRSLGVALAIDDFGTGYSSLTYLKRFPVQVLKLDREFVRGLGRDPADEAIVGAVVTLARSMGVVAIAEGIETAEQLQTLQQLGCDAAQGYLFARPLPIADATAMLERGASLLPT
jgi:diguanylate cyclase (GGDEF)-like protein/PAS domain S-box-containing protein